MSSALDLRTAFSRRRERRFSCSVGARPDSKDGDAMGESSVDMVKMPLNFRSGNGAVISAEMRARMLEIGG